MFSVFKANIPLFHRDTVLSGEPENSDPGSEINAGSSIQGFLTLPLEIYTSLREGSRARQELIGNFPHPVKLDCHE
jgi:hypothetical protein